MWHQTPPGGFRPTHCFRKLLAVPTMLGGDDAVLDDLLVVVDVVDEQVQRADPLLEAALDPVPFGGRDDPRDDVERKDPLGAGAVAVDVERDPHVQQRALGRLLAAQQLAVRHRLDQLDQRPGGRSRLAAGLEHLVEETRRSDSARISWCRLLAGLCVTRRQERRATSDGRALPGSSEYSGWCFEPSARRPKSQETRMSRSGRVRLRSTEHSGHDSHAPNARETATWCLYPVDLAAHYDRKWIKFGCESSFQQGQEYDQRSRTHLALNKDAPVSRAVALEPQAESSRFRRLAVCTIDTERSAAQS